MPDVFQIIKNSGLNERDKFPRTVAIKALGEYFIDQPETFQILLRAAKNDESPQQIEKEFEEPYYVRDAAIAAIFRHRPDHPETLSLLRDRAVFDPTPWLMKKAQTMLDQLLKRKSGI